MTIQEKADRLRAILRENRAGSGPALYATNQAGEMLRIFRVRVRKGTLESLAAGRWAEITSWETQP